MKTLDEIYNGVDNIPPQWSQKLPASERFVLVLGGEGVLDKETGLVWEQSPDATTRTWGDACYYCYDKEVGGRLGWRLPTIEELASLVDRSMFGQTPKTLPDGHPFSNLVGALYWSTSIHPTTPGKSLTINFNGPGLVTGAANSESRYSWCVRGAPGHNTNVQ
ncbi:MAG: DUF1566 domain-containing protein [Deltaproteobacteria bacterium]|nr:DUF1566 domain-containing protein [Deltaproteobacteria bacterium]